MGDELVFLALLDLEEPPFVSASKVYLFLSCCRCASRESWMYSLCLALSSFFLCISLSIRAFEVSASAGEGEGRKVYGFTGEVYMMQVTQMFD